MDDGLRKMLERNEARAGRRAGGWRRREVAQPDEQGIPYLSNAMHIRADNTPIFPIIFLSFAYVELAAVFSYARSSLLHGNMV